MAALARRCLAGITLGLRQAHHLVVVHLKHTTLISVIQSTLEVFGNLFLTELFFNTVDD